MSVLAEMAPSTRSSRPTGGQRARVVKPPTALDASLTVSLLSYSNDYEYEVPAANWISRGTALPIVGAVGVAVFDDHGDAWFLLGGGTEFPAGTGGGGTETDPIASAALTAHAADTTAIHGIPDTSLLVVTSDSRLTNARTPTGAAGGVLGGTFPNPSFAADMATQAELDAHAIDTTAVHGIADTSALVLTSDTRLTNARTPTAHKASHEPGGSDALTGLTNASIAAGAGIAKTKLASLDVVNADVNAAAAIARAKLDFGSGLVNADISATAAIAESKLSLATDAAAGTGSRRTLGTSATSAAAGNRGLPVGGTSGQVLAKASATDYDVAWVAAGGSPSTVLTQYKSVVRGHTQMATQGVAATFLASMFGTGVAALAGAGTAVWAFNLDPADLNFAGTTNQLKLRTTLITNAVAPGGTWTLTLRPVATFGGASAALPSIATLGTAVATNTYATPGATNGGVTTDSADVNFPAAGKYCFAIQTSAAMATNSNVVVIFEVLARQV